VFQAAPAEPPDPLAELVDRRQALRPEDERGAPIGQLRLLGHLRVGGAQSGFDSSYALEQLLTVPSDRAARAFAGLAHPVRIDIYKQLLAGPQDSQTLLHAAGLNTTGQLYHHLREMEAVGLIERRGRNLWAQCHLNQVAVALAAAADLAGWPGA